MHSFLKVQLILAFFFGFETIPRALAESALVGPCLTFKYEAYLTDRLEDPQIQKKKFLFAQYSFQYPYPGANAQVQFSPGTRNETVKAFGTDAIEKPGFIFGSSRQTPCVLTQRKKFDEFLISARETPSYEKTHECYTVLMRTYFLASDKTLDTSKYVYLELKSNSSGKVLSFAWPSPGSCNAPGESDAEELFQPLYR